MKFFSLPKPFFFFSLAIFVDAENKNLSVPLPPAKDFAVETVAANLSNPMEMAIAGDLVFIAELHGRVKVVDLKTGITTIAAHLAVDYRKKGPKWSWDVESGLMGIAVDPDFETNKWVYLCYSKPGGEAITHDHIVSRFRFEDGLLNQKSEQVILKIPSLRDKDRIHEAGSLAFGPEGNLYISLGDNQDHTQYLDAARTSTNSAVLNGKILRIRPHKNGGYSIPPGNLYPPNTPKARPEIYIMGLRNPFRISVDQKTGYLYWGENGPADYYCGNLKNIDQKYLPLGYDEFNQARAAGFFGWPFFIGPNETYPSYDFETNSVTGVFDKQKPVNHLKSNTGLRELPPTQKPMIWYSHPPSKKFPSLGQGGASAIGGPVFYYDESRTSPEGLPKSFDHHWFIADYARGWVKMVELDDDEKLVAIKSFPTNYQFQTPMNVKFNDRGQLFVLQYGKGGWDPDNGGSLVRISYRIDGGLAGHQVIASRPLRGLPSTHPGTALMRQNNCAACHQTQGALIGPSFQAITDRYTSLETRENYLAEQIKKGSKGIWGETYQMPPHPYLSDEQIEKMVDAICAIEIARHSAINRPVTLNTPASPAYPGSGPAELVDGIRGNKSDLKTDWLGFDGNDLIATIDLGREMPIHTLALSSCQVTAAGVFLPPSVEFFVSSDNKHFQSVAKIQSRIPVKQSSTQQTLTAEIETIQARFLRIHAKNLGTIPDWHPAKGRKAWLFVDEILVNSTE